MFYRSSTKGHHLSHVFPVYIYIDPPPRAPHASHDCAVYFVDPPPGVLSVSRICFVYFVDPPPGAPHVSRVYDIFCRSSTKGRHLTQGASVGYAMILAISCFAIMMSIVIGNDAVDNYSIYVSTMFFNLGCLGTIFFQEQFIASNYH